MLTLTNPAERSTPGNNDLIRTLPSEFDNVDVLNWDALAEGCQSGRQVLLPGNCFGGDGLHLSADGADYYAALISECATQLGLTI